MAKSVSQEDKKKTSGSLSLLFGRKESGMERKSQYKHRAKNVAKIRQRHKEEELGKINLDNSSKKYLYPSDDMFIRRTCFVLSTCITVMCSSIYYM